MSEKTSSASSVDCGKSEKLVNTMMRLHGGAAVALSGAFWTPNALPRDGSHSHSLGTHSELEFICGNEVSALRSALFRKLGDLRDPADLINRC